MKVVLYRRLSKKTEGNQYGFDSQESDIRQWLSATPDSEVIGEFGEFYSGRGHFSKRVEFNKALAMCKAQGATLIVNKPDRLARDVESGAHILNNYSVIFTNYPDADMLTKHILLTVAQAESDKTSERVTAALKIAIAKGVKVGGSNAAWKSKFNENHKAGLHKVNRKREIQVSAQEPIVNEVRAMIEYSTVRPSQAELLSMISRKGFKSSTGKEFTQPMLSRLIKKWGV